MSKKKQQQIPEDMEEFCKQERERAEKKGTDDIMIIEGTSPRQKHSLQTMYEIYHWMKRNKVNTTITYHPHPFWHGKRVDRYPLKCSSTLTHQLFTDVFPTQAVVTDEMVENKIEQLKKTPDKSLTVGLGICYTDKSPMKYYPVITDGHHAFLASMYTGNPITFKIKNKRSFCPVPRVFGNQKCKKEEFLSKFSTLQIIQGKNKRQQFLKRMGMR